MDTDTVAGLSFILSGLVMFGMFAMFSMQTAISMSTISYLIISVALLSVGTIMTLREQDTTQTSHQRIIFPALAVLLFASGFVMYTYI